MDAKAKAALLADVRDFAVPAGRVVPRVHRPSAVEFLRDFVACNKPCILTGLLDGAEWHEARRWTPEGLQQAAGPTRKVRVNVTPDGHGDCVREAPGGGGRAFVKPWETRLSWAELARHLAEPEEGFVPYLSHQDDNLRDGELDFLAAQVPPVLPLAAEALGALDAVNLWMGDERAVSAMHQDYYENMYCVVRGQKLFHLLPPMVHPGVFLGERDFPPARFELGAAPSAAPGAVKSEYAWRIRREDGPDVAWIPLDPTQLANTHPQIAESLLEVRVEEGEVLFLPAMWLHRATQTRLTISVNYWHDMAFDQRWVFNSFLGRLVAPPAPDQTASDAT